MKFQKRIKLFPGVTLNVSKSGVTTSIGPRGAKLNVGGKRAKLTVGVPGTGLSHTRTLGGKLPDSIEPPPTTQRAAGRSSGWIWLVLGGLFLLAVLLH